MGAIARFFSSAPVFPALIFLLLMASRVHAFAFDPSEPSATSAFPGSSLPPSPPTPSAASESPTQTAPTSDSSATPSPDSPATLPRPSTADLPLARGDMRFDPVMSRFEGEMEWEVRTPGEALTLLLYPNRYLASAERDDREMVEAYGSELSDFDRMSLKRHGSLLVESASERRYSGSSCSDALARDTAPVEERAIARAFNTTETILTLDPAGTVTGTRAPPLAGDGCRTLRVKFRLQPPFSAGNYGMITSNIMRFAGPMFPFPQAALYDTRVLVRGFPLSCADCVQRESGVEIISRGFPSPLLFSKLGGESRVTFVGGLRVEFVGDANEDLETHLLTMLKRMMDENELLAGLSNPVQPYSLRIHENLLLKNLAMRQPGEIQIGKGFLKVTPLFEKYHDAAFLRVTFQELTYQALVRATAPRTTSDLRTLTSLSRLLAEERVANWFASLSEIQDWSERFKFIPLFNDILRGKALVNNDVFLGTEESPNPVDTAPSEAMFPVFRGREVKDRLAWCDGDLLVQSFYTESSLLFLRQIDAARFVNRWVNVPMGRCRLPFASYLAERTQQEAVVVTQDRLFGGTSRVNFRRIDEALLPQDLFQPQQQKRPYDTIRFVVESENAGVKVSQESSSGGDTRVIAVPRGGTDAKATIDGPNTGREKDVQVLPRKLDFLLTGIKLNFSSRSGGIEGQQGVQWRVRGDEYARAFTLLVRKEKSIYYFSPVFSATVGGESEATDDVNVDESMLLRLPNQFPINLGLETEISKKTELWAFASLGARAVTSSILVPSGYETQLSVTQSLVRPREKTQGLKTELNSRVYLPVARLTTGVLSLRLGQSNESEELGGSGVPGVEGDALVAKRYGVLRSELRYVLLYNLKWNIFSTVLFEDVILYGAHNLAVDTDRFRLASPSFNSITSVQFGVSLYGAFFGAKNQSVTFDVARGLEDKPRNTFAVSVGRTF